MNRSSFSLIGSFVLAAGISVTAAGASTANGLTFTPQAGETSNASAFQELLADEPANGNKQAAPKVDLPEVVKNAVLKDAAARSQMQMSQLQIVQVKQQTWTDGCLGLATAGVSCTQATVPGWLVLVGGAEKNFWVYRTDITGSVVKWDEASTQELTARLRQETQNSQTTTTRTETTQQSSTTTQRNIQTSFSDVAEGHWARAYIAELASQEIIEGFPDGRFRPDQPVTRGQFAAMIRKAFKKDKVRNAIAFRGISKNHWAYNAIRESYEMGFLGTESGNQFNPTQNLSRLQILVALAKGLDYSSTSSTSQMLMQTYSDASRIPSSFRTLVAAATERGMVVNYPDVKSFNPTKVATRADVAAFIYQGLVSTGKASSISSPYVVGVEKKIREAGAAVETQREGGAAVETQREGGAAVETQRQGSDRVRPNCNQGIGNGAEGCDPGNSSPRGGSNDEGGRTPGGGAK